MKDLMLYVDMVMNALPIIFSAVVGIATIINQFMPDKITNETLAKFEAFTSKFSTGSKKATIEKK